MRGYLTIRNATTALSGIILIGVALSDAAYAINSMAFRYSTEQTGYLTIGPPAFVATNNNYDYFNNGDVLGAGAEACFLATVNLPHGAKIAAFTLWYSKSDNIDSAAALLRVATSTATRDNLAMVTKANTGNARIKVSRSVTNPSLQTVNNAQYFYAVFHCLTLAEGFWGARIKYTYRTAGD
jgi:hypothetical protein